MTLNIENILKTARTIAVAGLSDKKVEQILQEARIPYIMDSCIFVEHRMANR